MPPKTVLITGCSEGGIGHSLALEWKAKGYRVFPTARSLKSMASLQTAGFECFEMDVTKPDTLNAVKEQVTEKTGGKLDILVNNAGQGFNLPILDADLDAAKKLFDVNFWGVIATTQTFAPLLISAEGTIVIIGSCGGILPYPFAGIYGASKSAVMYIADVLKYEMYPFNVKVLNICTGGVKSHMPTNTTKNFDHSIPPNSVYHPIAETVAHAQDGRTEKFMDTKEYTRYVVDKVNAARKSGWIWRGAYATSVWFVNTFLWRSALDSIHLKENGLYELKKSVEKEKGKAQ